MDPARLPPARYALAPGPQIACYLPWLKVSVALRHVLSFPWTPEGRWVLGLCGGYQMLGDQLDDQGGTEGGPGTWPGLGLLPIRTVFEPEKRTQQSRCVSAWPVAGRSLVGYEIHHGRSSATGGGEHLLLGAGTEMGWRQGRVVGCYLHGLLTDDEWRGAFLNAVRKDRGRPLQPVRVADPIDLRIDRWAQHLRRSFRGDTWSRLLSTVTGTRTSLPQ